MKAVHVRTARVALVAALLASAITFTVTALFDPFGFEAGRADYAARRAAAITLCVKRDTYQYRVDHPGTLKDPSLRATLDLGLRRTTEAEAQLGIQCPEITPTKEDNP